MTTPESPSLLLQRAAERLEQIAEHFDAYVKSESHPGETGSPVTWWVYDTVDRMAPTRARRWVETMTPAVAQPLVNILRGVAFTLACHPEYAETEKNYIELAHLILGEAPSE